MITVRSRLASSTLAISLLAGLLIGQLQGRSSPALGETPAPKVVYFLGNQIASQQGRFTILALLQHCATKSYKCSVVTTWQGVLDEDSAFPIDILLIDDVSRSSINTSWTLAHYRGDSLGIIALDTNGGELGQITGDPRIVRQLGGAAMRTSHPCGEYFSGARMRIDGTTAALTAVAPYYDDLDVADEQLDIPTPEHLEKYFGTGTDEICNQFATDHLWRSLDDMIDSVRDWNTDFEY